MASSVFPEASSGSAYTAGTTFGVTAGRPASPTVGQTYYNGTLAAFEIWNGSVWAAINSIPASVSNVIATDQGSGRAFASNGSASVAFTPATVGGAATSFVVTSSPGGFSGTGASSPIVLTGQTPGVSYTYSVVAANSLGSATAISSTAVTATTLAAVISAPTATTNANGTSDVSWTAPSTGGSAITQYTVTSSPGSITTTTSGTSVTVTGLTNGTAYTFTVTATNANGTNAASSASNSVTPFSVPVGEYLVVGGGGSAPGGSGSGAGGGGTVKQASNYTFPASFTVTVGNANANAAGSASVFGSITAAGGGAGGVNSVGGTGGNGGGAHTSSATIYGVSTATDGFAGGANSSAGSTYSNHGGGGGAGGAASTVNAGPGVSNSITGAAVFYGAGGAGGVYTTNGTTQTNGGVRGFSAPTANTGGGSGSSGSASLSGTAGVVILAYPTSTNAFSSIGGGLTYTVDTTTRAGYRIYKFTAGTGTVTV